MGLIDEKTVGGKYRYRITFPFRRDIKQSDF
jgi:hypothetical protein